MPWTTADAKAKNKNIKTDAEAKKWVKRANGFLSSCLAGKSEPMKGASGETKIKRCEASAIMLANAAFDHKAAYNAGCRMVRFGYENITEAIQEIDAEKRIVVLRIIQGDNSDILKEGDPNFHRGWSKNGFYYSQQCIKELIPFIEQSRMIYLDHNDIFPFGRSMNDWCATIIEGSAREENAGAYVNARIVDNHNDWVLDVMKNHPELVGLSIDAYAQTEESEKHGIQGRAITRWIELHSSDFVTRASAKGNFVSFAEAIKYPDGVCEMERILQSLGDSIDNEDIIEQPKGRNAEMELKEIKELTIDQIVASGNTVISEAVAKKETEVKESFKPTMQELETAKSQINELTEKVKVLEAEKSALIIKVSEFDAKEKAVAKQQFINEAKKELKLADESIDAKLMEVLMKQTEEEVKTTLTAIAESVKKAITTNIITDNPAPKDEKLIENKKVYTDDEIAAVIKRRGR